MREAMRVVSCGLVDVVAARNPYRVGVLPEGSDELDEPGEINVVRRSIVVVVLEDSPVACNESS